MSVARACRGTPACAVVPPMTERRATRRHAPRGRGGRSLLSFDIRWPKLPKMPHVADLRSHRGVWVAAGLVAILLAAVVADVASSFGRIHPGVTVGGVALGGMTTGEARAALLKEMEPRVALPVTVAYESRRWTVKSARIGARFTPQVYVERAYALGREGSPARALGDRIGAWFGRRQLPLAVEADDEKLGGLIAELGKAVFVPARDAGVVIEGTKVTRVSAASGRRVLDARLAQAVVEAFVSPQRIVRLPVETYAPRVADSDADQAYLDAQKMLSGDLELTYETKSWKFTPDKLAHWIAFRPVPFTEASRTPSPTATAETGLETASATATTGPGPASAVRMVLQAYVSAAEVSSTLEPVVTGLGKPAKDATFNVRGKSVTVVPGQVGTGVDIVALSTAIDTALKAGGPRAVPLSLTKTAPRITTEQARGMGIRELISSYSTEYDAGNRPRVNNIHTLAQALDGKLVPPGGTFSFNGAVGERTAEKGYQEAPAIVNGRLVPQLGGGICQIGTTFFNAVFFSGFPVLERTNHSFYISHYPKGRDCTVSWGGPDFRWKNDTKNWVLVKTDYDSSSITISLYGTDPGYKVAYTTGPFTNVRPYATSEEKDPTLPVGERHVVDSGVDGRKVIVVRTVTLNGALVRKDDFVSVYRPKDATVKVGTQAPSQPATETPKPGT
jgi:vancomycin resistance protein YoaR